jgi:hypothetical protein
MAPQAHQSTARNFAPLATQRLSCLECGGGRLRFRTSTSWYEIAKPIAEGEPVMRALAGRMTTPSDHVTASRPDYRCRVSHRYLGFRRGQNDAVGLGSVGFGG